MKILRPGHTYELENFERFEERGQVLQFIEKMPSPIPDAPMITCMDGTTNEEVLRVLIDRIQSLQAKFSCRENAIVLTKLQESLFWLEKRTLDRAMRGVEGKAQA